jgi:hypothetical protein
VPAFLPSELPLQARARHHWIVLFRRPHPVLTVALLILFLAAVLDPSPMAWPFLLVLGAGAYLRWKTWTSELLFVTRRRIVRMRGIPETTTTEASLRLDRISGVVLEQTVVGKLLNYGTLELEAPGQHPDLRRIEKIARPRRMYFLIREIVYGEPESDRLVPIAEASTAPLPVLPPWGPRHRRS